MTNSLQTLVAGLTGLLLITGCGGKNIEGSVRDNFGNPLAEVTVAINNSAFSAITNHNGVYKIDYVPGDISLTYSKEGFTDAAATLNISQKAKYPMKDVVLIKIPQKGGIFLVGEDDYIALAKVAVKTKTEEYRFSWNGPLKRTWYSIDTSNLTEIAGTARIAAFADAVPSRLRLQQVDSEGQVGEAVAYYMGPKDVFNIIEEEVFQMEGFTIRRAPLDPGIYCFLTVGTTLMGAAVLMGDETEAYCIHLLEG